MNKLLVLLVCGAVGSAAAQAPIMTNARASGAPAISGDLIAFPAAQVVDNNVVHTLKYYSISSGVTIDTGKRVAMFSGGSNVATSPSISGSTIAYIAPSVSFNLGQVRHFNVTTGQDIDTGKEVPLLGTGWSTRLASISGDLIAYVTPEFQLGYYRLSTGTATNTGVEAHGKPGVSGSLIAYLNGNGCTIRYYNVATAVDTSIGHFNQCDEAPAISGNVIAFSNGLTNTIVHHNIATGITSDTGSGGFYRSVSGNVIAFMGANLLRYYRIDQQSAVETGLALYTQPDVSDGVIAFAPFGDGSDPFNAYRIAYMRVEGADSTTPSITISSPVATAYNLGQTVAAQFSCSDAESGIASCSGSVPNGQYIDTATEGTKVFTVNATDAAGNNASRSVTYTVARRPPAGTPTADLGLAMTHDAARKFVASGTLINYTLTPANAGPSSAEALQLRNDIPVGMAVEGASVGYNILPGGSTGSQVVFDLGTLAPGGQIAVTLTMRILASTGATIDNTASVVSATFDPRTNNNVAKAILKVK